MTLDTPNRRLTARRRAEDYGIRFGRVRPGHEVSVLDLSSGGARIECSRRLLPGTPVDLHFKHESRQLPSVRGRVAWCRVVGVRSNAVLYRGAIAFERQLSWASDNGDAG